MGVAMSEEQGMIKPDQGEVTLNAMLLNPTLPFDEWEKIGSQLSTIQEGLMFWVGDWLNFGEEHFGEAYAQAMEATGYSYNTLKTAKYVTKKFPPELRINSDNIKFTHYSAVAGKEPEEAISLLRDASENRLTVSELKAKISGGKPSKGDEQDAPGESFVHVTCPNCQHNFEALLN